jgi:ribosomal-protein-alanine N-acetyltransferase
MAQAQGSGPGVGALAEVTIRTGQLELRPLPPRAAEALLAGDRSAGSREVRSQLDSEWPQPDLLDILPRQACLAPDQAVWGIWVMLDRDTGLVVGDVGFHGPPSDDGSVEVGFCVVPSRRRRRYASQAATALVSWAKRQPGVLTVLAGCDPANRASIGTLRRAGFEQAGGGPDELRWRLSDA